MDEKAQVALEYLLIIVAGIVFVSAVALFIKTSINTMNSAVDTNTIPKN